MQADPADTIDEALLYNPHKAAVSASSIIMFAFTCQVNVPALYDELEQRTPAQMRRVSARAVLIALVFYGAIGVAGYANFPHSHQGPPAVILCVASFVGSLRRGSERPRPPVVELLRLGILVASPLAIVYELSLHARLAHRQLLDQWVGLLQDGARK